MGSDLPVVSGRCTPHTVAMVVVVGVVMLVTLLGMVVGLDMRELHQSTHHLMQGYKGIVTTLPPQPWVEQEDLLQEDCPFLQLIFLRGAG